jgi:hypothetical protein
MVPFPKGHDFSAIRRLARHSHVRLAADDGGQTLQDGYVIVGDQNANLAWNCGLHAELSGPIHAKLTA